MSEGGQPSVAGPRANAPMSSAHNFYGGLVLVAFAAIAIVLSLFVRNTAMFGPVMMPRLFAILVGLAGIALVSGRMAVRAPQDFYGGAALVGLAIIAMLASNELPGQRGFAFGPGTAPRLFATLLATLGCIIALIGVFVQGPPLERYKVRGVIFITASILIFAATIRPLGLVIASFSCILACAAADPEVRWRETIAWAIVLTAFCSFLFPYGLNLPFQLWPRQWL
jgi:putative tricarboxylic transport membrane protein